VAKRIGQFVRTASAALIAYINTLRAQPDMQAIIADCYTFTLLSGTILTYTDADVPITLNGLVYSASSILVSGLKFKCSAGLEVDQQQITIAAKPTDLVAGVPFLEALANGVFDGCEIQRERAFLNSWSLADTANPIGSVILFKGRIGTVDSIGRTSAQITVNSDLVLLDLQMPRNVYSPGCLHVLYDSGCAILKSAFSTSGTAGAGSTFVTINWSGATLDYQQGTISFTSGINSGISANIKTAVPGVSLTLSYPLGLAPNAGDAFTASFGCDHTQATCTTKFDNLVNFRGFPFVPSATYGV
jgi:uncharacterized phage protein (TIGR02218 family)